MRGLVDWLNRPVLPIVLEGPYGRLRGEALIDTGFSGSICLPPPIIRNLGLRPGNARLTGLADGSTVITQAYWVSIDWLLGPTRCIAEEVDLDVWLLGRALLAGHVLEIDFGAAKTVEVR